MAATALGFRATRAMPFAGALGMRALRDARASGFGAWPKLGTASLALMHFAWMLGL